MHAGENYSTGQPARGDTARRLVHERPAFLLAGRNSVHLGLFRVLDDELFHRRFGGYQLQPKLFLNGREDRKRRDISSRSVAIGGPLQLV